MLLDLRFLYEQSGQVYEAALLLDSAAQLVAGSDAELAASLSLASQTLLLQLGGFDREDALLLASQPLLDFSSEIETITRCIELAVSALRAVDLAVAASLGIALGVSAATDLDLLVAGRRLSDLLAAGSRLADLLSAAAREVDVTIQGERRGVSLSVVGGPDVSVDVESETREIEVAVDGHRALALLVAGARAVALTVVSCEEET